MHGSSFGSGKERVCTLTRTSPFSAVHAGASATSSCAFAFWIQAAEFCDMIDGRMLEKVWEEGKRVEREASQRATKTTLIAAAVIIPLSEKPGLGRLADPRTRRPKFHHPRRRRACLCRMISLSSKGMRIKVKIIVEQKTL